MARIQGERCKSWQAKVWRAHSVKPCQTMKLHTCLWNEECRDFNKSFSQKPHWILAGSFSKCRGTTFLSWALHCFLKSHTQIVCQKWNISCTAWRLRGFHVGRPESHLCWNMSLQAKRFPLAGYTINYFGRPFETQTLQKARRHVLAFGFYPTSWAKSSPGPAQMSGVEPDPVRFQVQVIASLQVASSWTFLLNFFSLDSQSHTMTCHLLLLSSGWWRHND